MTFRTVSPATSVFMASLLLAVSSVCMPAHRLQAQSIQFRPSPESGSAQDSAQAEYQRIFDVLQKGSPDDRKALATQLPTISSEFRIPLLQKLLTDPDSRVLIATLDAARKLPVAPQLIPRIQQLTDTPDRILVRQYAELVLSEWRVDQLRNPQDPRTSQDASGRSSRPAAPVGATAPSGTAGQIQQTAALTPPELNGPIVRVPPAPLPTDGRPGDQSDRGALNSLVSDFERSIQQFQSDPLMTTESQSGPAGGVPLQRDNPAVLRPPFEDMPSYPDEIIAAEIIGPQPGEHLAPLGFTGPSGILPSESQSSPHFVPVHDRWRSGFPDWDRLENPDDPQDNYPYTKGHWWDPYNQNVLKGDYPIIGQHTFLNITASSQMIHEYRQVPTPTTPFESTINPFQEEFFGNPDQYFYTHFLTLNVELFHGSTAFKPFDWRVRVAPVLNFNYLDTNELGIVNPDVREGTTRFRDYVALEQWFVEAKLADLGPDYDFLSARVGSQPIVTDFRGLVLADINRGARLFGTRNQNREQFNVWWLDQTEKDTNSQLNTFDDRHQNTIVLNYFRQDTFVPGYTLQGSFHYNRDQSSVEFDDNDFLVRPDPAGIFQPHEVEAFYYGIAGDGHFGLLNVSHAFYHVQGSDSRSPLGGEQSDINANMLAVELSVDRDWIRFRTSYFWASGDDDPNDGKAEGFDTILDNPNFAGGEFSYWNRQEIRLFGLGLSQRLSLVPNLRSSKTQGQSNFVNPGIQIVNLGMDFEITPKTKAITNMNWLWFDKTAVLEQFAFQDNIDPKIGIDLSLGIEYRPLLNDNIQIIGGVSMLVPDRGFKDLYGITDPFSRQHADVTGVDNLYAGFIDVILTY